MHKEVIHMHGLQVKCKYFVKTLRNVQAAITFVHEWSIQYKGALLELGKMKMQEVELEKTKVCMLIQNNKQFTSFISNTQASYARFYNSLNFLVKSHEISSFDSLTGIKLRNQVRQKIEEYLEQLRQVAIKEYLEVNRQKMYKYIGGPIQINIMFLLLKKETQTGSKLVIPWRLESASNLTPLHSLGKSLQNTNFGSYVTKKHQAEVVELEFPKLKIKYFVLLGCLVDSTQFCIIWVRVYYNILL